MNQIALEIIMIDREDIKVGIKAAFIRGQHTLL